jgi:Fic family protein
MSASSHSFSPFVPDDKALSQSELPDLARQLDRAASQLGAGIGIKTRRTLANYLRVINSYYSNLIEGNRTLPHEIRAAQKGDYSTDPTKRNLQFESVAHLYTQSWLSDQPLSPSELFNPNFIQKIHATFYRQMPEALHQIAHPQTGETLTIEPGAWRTRGVRVGQYIPPEATDIPDLISNYCAIYDLDKFKGDRKIIAIMAAHHRLAWIHPFLDGNGRVGRLLTDNALALVGTNTDRIWCLSRGLARASERYKELLARADFPRQGNHDGRGLLSQTALIDFCKFMLETALDQINYIGRLLRIDGMRQRIESYVRARNDGLIRDCTRPLKPEAARIIHMAFLHGELGRADAISLCGGSERTARRLLQQLKEEELLSETSSRSPLSWEIPAHAEAYYFPDMAPSR